MLRLMFVTCCLVACGGSARVAPLPQPAPIEVALWPGAVPDARPVTAAESRTTETDPLIAGKPWTEIHDVSRPTMTVYPARGANTGVAVVVFPGGGYKALAIDLEGTEVCDWLTPLGITCVVLKYRVPFTGPYGDAKLHRHVMPDRPIALEDAQRTVGLVRSRAAEWGIDPKKIGVLGFSAGGHLVAAISTRFAQREYSPVDAADGVSCRPDFGVALYPGHLWNQDEDKFELLEDVATRVSKDTSPQLLLQAGDDPVDHPNHSLVYYIALQKAGVPVEMHIYAQGGHAFGLRPTDLPITRWPRLVETWLHTLGML